MARKEVERGNVAAEAYFKGLVGMEEEREREKGGGGEGRGRGKVGRR
jgi:hypothetical protein